MNGSQNRYQFAPLRDDGDSTRVLYLAPGKSEDPLQGSLRVVSLSEPPDYEALSYEWASPEKTHTIVLHDVSDTGGGRGSAIIPITESLYQALRDLRHEGENRDRAIWADAVCIDQENVIEQHTQVAIMGTIYRAAVRVVTYVGPEREDSVAAIGLAPGPRQVRGA